MIPIAILFQVLLIGVLNSKDDIDVIAIVVYFIAAVVRFL